MVVETEPKEKSVEKDLDSVDNVPEPFKIYSLESKFCLG